MYQLASMYHAVSGAGEARPVPRARPGAGQSAVPRGLSDEWLYWDPEALETFPTGQAAVDRSVPGSPGDAVPLDRRPPSSGRPGKAIPGDLCLAGAAGGGFALCVYLLLAGAAAAIP